jgi:hypothetical protein
VEEADGASVTVDGNGPHPAIRFRVGPETGRAVGVDGYRRIELLVRADWG